MLDHTDLKLLKLLSKNSRTTVKNLSKEVALSEPSVKTRIQRLMDEEILNAFTVDIDYKKLGYILPLFVKISDLTISAQKFVSIVEEISAFVSIYAVTGEENYILFGHARSVSEVEEILSKLMAYGKVSTSIILEEKNNKKFIDDL
ncbi:lrp/AsnC family transcriptional regulator, leucine-responsive regulatory protein [Enterococcus sp. AZ048]|uniref:Lrp/AsnC family transcriptional regulator n=1 Tax=Enterococcus sp. AZ048 TaxID=2774658 RepID=UPI003F24722B